MQHTKITYFEVIKEDYGLNKKEEWFIKEKTEELHQYLVNLCGRFDGSVDLEIKIEAKGNA